MIGETCTCTVCIVLERMRAQCVYLIGLFIVARLIYIPACPVFVLDGWFIVNPAHSRRTGSTKHALLVCCLWRGVLKFVYTGGGRWESEEDSERLSRVCIFNLRVSLRPTFTAFHTADISHTIACAERVNNGRLWSLCRFGTQQSSSKASLVSKTK